VRPGDGFVMEPGFRNLQAVEAGQVLARDRLGEITAVCDARILMPLYQDQGNDGFFLAREVSDDG
jgi:succinylglutamate desuccinylase